MELFRETVEKHRQVKPSTLKLYETNIKKICKEISVEYLGPHIFCDKEKIKNVINKFNVHKRRLYYSTILIALSPKGKNMPLNKYKNLYMFYNKLLQEANDEYMTAKVQQKQNEKEISNWVSYDKIRQKALILGENILNSYDLYKVQKALVSALYSDLPPRRADYAEMSIITEKEFIKLYLQEKIVRNFVKTYGIQPKPEHLSITKNNYLVVTNEEDLKPIMFSMGNEKNKVKAKQSNNAGEVKFSCYLVVDKDMKLYKLLHHFLQLLKQAFNNDVVGQSLLYDRNKQPMTRNGLSKYIANIFTFGHKKVGITMLRHIFISEFYATNPPLVQKLKIAEHMNHSVTVAESIYAKRLKNP